MNTPCQADFLESVPRRGIPFGVIYTAYLFTVTMALVGLIGPWMEEVYWTVDVPMPIVTVAALDLSHSFVKSWLVWPMLAAFSLWWLWKRGFDRGLTIVSTTVIGAFWLVYVIGLLMPVLPWIQPP